MNRKNYSSSSTYSNSKDHSAFIWKDLEFRGISCICVYIYVYINFTNMIVSGATALQGLGRQSGRRRSAKLVPTLADRGVSRGQRNGSPRPLISVYRTGIAN